MTLARGHTLLSFSSENRNDKRCLTETQTNTKSTTKRDQTQCQPSGHRVLQNETVAECCLREVELLIQGGSCRESCTREETSQTLSSVTAHQHQDAFRPNGPYYIFKGFHAHACQRMQFLGIGRGRHTHVTPLLKSMPEQSSPAQRTPPRTAICAGSLTKHDGTRHDLASPQNRSWLPGLVSHRCALHSMSHEEVPAWLALDVTSFGPCLASEHSLLKSAQFGGKVLPIAANAQWPSNTRGGQQALHTDPLCTMPCYNSSCRKIRCTRCWGSQMIKCRTAWWHTVFMDEN